MKKIYILISLCTFGATMNAQTWNSLGTGSASSSSAILINGTDIYAGGNFMNGADVFSFGKFSGGQWTALGNWKGINGGIGVVYASLILGDNLYVAGAFNNGAGIPEAKGVGRFHIPSQTWHAMGTGITSSGFANALATDGTNIYLGGKFTEVGGVANTQFLAKWDGTSWSPVGTGISGGNVNFNSVNALSYNGGSLYIGSNFENMNNISDADYILKWNGTNYEAVGNSNGYMGAVFDIDFSPSGELHIGGEFVQGRIAKFNGTSWEIIGGGVNQVVNSIEFFNNELYIGGNFTNAGGDENADYIAKLEGSTWVNVAGGFNQKVNKLASSDKLYAVGHFTDVGGNTAVDYIAVLGSGSSANIFELDNSKFSVFPNPTSSVINVEVEKASSYQITNLLGSIVKEGLLDSGKNHLNIESLAKGNYLLKVENVTKQITIH
jgi:trimeric autotransporter adhesin